MFVKIRDRTLTRSEVSAIYHVDLHGNVRRNPKLSGTTHNVFGIQVGVGITVAIRMRENETKLLQYVRLPEDWRREVKLHWLAEHLSLTKVDWTALNPDNRGTWLATENTE